MIRPASGTSHAGRARVPVRGLPITTNGVSAVAIDRIKMYFPRLRALKPSGQSFSGPSIIRITAVDDTPPRERFRRASAGLPLHSRIQAILKVPAQVAATVYVHRENVVPEPARAIRDGERLQGPLTAAGSPFENADERRHLSEFPADY